MENAHHVDFWNSKGILCMILEQKRVSCFLENDDKSKQSASEILLNRERIHKNSLILRSLK